MTGPRAYSTRFALAPARGAALGMSAIAPEHPTRAPASVTLHGSPGLLSVTPLARISARIRVAGCVVTSAPSSSLRAAYAASVSPSACRAATYAARTWLSAATGASTPRSPVPTALRSP